MDNITFIICGLGLILVVGLAFNIILVRDRGGYYEWEEARKGRK